MTLPPLPDLREAFEAYFANSRRGRGVKKIPVFKRLPDDSYADEPTQRHWWTWQNAARAAIAAHVPEAAFGNIAAVPAQPVAEVRSGHEGFSLALLGDLPPDGTKLYTHAAPAQRQPLTRQQVYQAGNLVPLKGSICTDWFEAGVRYAEAAHGITAAPAAKGE